ncbi:MAG: DsbA family protein [Pseudomonadota bacterium]
MTFRELIPFITTFLLLSSNWVHSSNLPPDPSTKKPPTTTANFEKVDGIQVDVLTSLHCADCYLLQHFLKQHDFDARVSVTFRPVIVWPSWRNAGAIFETLKALKRSDLLDAAYKKQIPEGNQPLSIEDWTQWIIAQGIEEDTFLQTLRSAAVNQELENTHQLRRQWGVQQVPAIIVDGKQLLLSEQLETPRKAITLIDSSVKPQPPTP